MGPAAARVPPTCPSQPAAGWIVRRKTLTRQPWSPRASVGTSQARQNISCWVGPVTREWHLIWHADGHAATGRRRSGWLLLLDARRLQEPVLIWLGELPCLHPRRGLGLSSRTAHDLHAHVIRGAPHPHHRTRTLRSRRAGPAANGLPTRFSRNTCTQLW